MIIRPLASWWRHRVYQEWFQIEACPAPPHFAWRDTRMYRHDKEVCRKESRGAGCPSKRGLTVVITAVHSGISG